MDSEIVFGTFLVDFFWRNIPRARMHSIYLQRCLRTLARGEKCWPQQSLNKKLNAIIIKVPGKKHINNSADEDLTPKKNEASRGWREKDCASLTVSGISKIPQMKSRKWKHSIALLMTILNGFCVLLNVSTNIFAPKNPFECALIRLDCAQGRKRVRSARLPKCGRRVIGLWFWFDGVEKRLGSLNWVRLLHFLDEIFRIVL